MARGGRHNASGWIELCQNCCFDIRNDHCHLFTVAAAAVMVVQK